MPLSYNHPAAPLPRFENEQQLVCHALKFEPQEIPPSMAPWVETHTAIAEQFSRPHPSGAGLEMISPSRAAGIPFITGRWMELVTVPGPMATNEDILTEWRRNTPSYRQGRHADELFDIAQWNFGSDKLAECNRAAVSATWLHRERIAVARQYRGAVHRLLAPLRFGGEVPEEVVDSLIDRLYGS